MSVLSTKNPSTVKMKEHLVDEVNTLLCAYKSALHLTRTLIIKQANSNFVKIEALGVESYPDPSKCQE